MKTKILAFVAAIVVGVLTMNHGDKAQAAELYTVKAGDTLWAIAQAHNSTVADIEAANGMTSTLIYPNQRLAIPPTRDSIVNTAEKYVGVPYVWGGSTPAGFDCSGFTQYVFKANGIDLLHSAHLQADEGTFVPASKLQRGDLVFFQDTYVNTWTNRVTHVGIYVGNGKMIAAGSKGVSLVNMWSPYYDAHYYGSRDVIQ